MDYFITLEVFKGSNENEDAMIWKGTSKKYKQLEICLFQQYWTTGYKMAMETNLESQDNI